MLHILCFISAVDIEGSLVKANYARRYSNATRLKYSYAPVHWSKFAEDVNNLYAEIRDGKK